MSSTSGKCIQGQTTLTFFSAWTWLCSTSAANPRRLPGQIPERDPISFNMQCRHQRCLPSAISWHASPYVPSTVGRSVLETTNTCRSLFFYDSQRCHRRAKSTCTWLSVSLSHQCSTRSRESWATGWKITVGDENYARRQDVCSEPQYEATRGCNCSSSPVAELITNHWIPSFIAAVSMDEQEVRRT